MKTQCNEVREKLDRFLDGDLPDPKRTELASHLETCPECREQLQDAQRAMAAMSELPRLTCPDRVAQRIEEAVAAQDREPSLADRLRDLAGSLRWRPVAVALPIVAVVLLVMLIYPRSEIPESSTYSEDEIQTAQKQATWTLSYVAQTINNAQERSVEELVRESLRSMIRTRLRDAVQRTEGDQS